jgi:hypothetical protein
LQEGLKKKGSRRSIFSGTKPIILKEADREEEALPNSIISKF